MIINYDLWLLTCTSNNGTKELHLLTSSPDFHFFSTESLGESWQGRPWSHPSMEKMGLPTARELAL